MRRTVCLLAGIAGAATARAEPTLELATIPAGRFAMGASPADGGESDSPEHDVVVSRPYLLATTEVTQAQYQELMGSLPACEARDGVPIADPAFPVVCVTWAEAVAFANALSRKEGLPEAYRIEGDAVTWDRSSPGYRLPTEAEWEYAARAGSRSAWGAVAKEAEVCRIGNVTGACDDGAAGPARVASYRANAWGVYDTAGNAWEWTWDFYETYPPGAATDPAGPERGGPRVLRGGGWAEAPAYAQVHYRNASDPSRRAPDVGFRLARTPAK